MLNSGREVLLEPVKERESRPQASRSSAASEAGGVVESRAWSTSVLRRAFVEARTSPYACTVHLVNDLGIRKP